jgi:hypothetical protein
VLEPRRIDESGAIGDLLGTAHFPPLPTLDGLDEIGRLQQRFVRAGIEPGGAASQQFDAQPPFSR